MLVTKYAKILITESKGVFNEHKGENVRKKKLLTGIILAVVTGIVLFSIALAVWLYESKRNLTLERIAYDRSPNNPVVYIKENGEYVPYLVLESDYDGHVLLLREHLLEEEMQYEPASDESGGGGLSGEGGLSGGWVWYDYGSYYQKSRIDKYLNMQFPKVFGDAVQAAIVETTIEVTDMDSYHEENWAEATHMIKRKVFLLSAVEMGIDSGIGYVMTKEGKPLRYFKHKDLSEKKATKADGEAWPYWTRTPHIGETCTVTVIGIDIFGDATADRRLGVRPAFCMEKDTAVKVNDNIIEGESVYVLELDDG